MTPLLRAGLGGLAASLRAHVLEERPKRRWPSSTVIGGATWTVEPRHVTVDWGSAHPKQALEALFAHAFRLTKEGMIDLPGTYDWASPPTPELRAALHAATKRTFLQHGKSRTEQGDPRIISFEMDGLRLNCAYQPCASYGHQTASDRVSAALDRPVQLAGWAYPGASQRHKAFAKTKQEYGFSEAICALFALVGTVSLDEPLGASGALVIPEPVNLVAFAAARPRMTPRTLRDIHIAGIGDAVLSMELALRLDEAAQRDAVSSTRGVLLRATPWATQQKTRVETLQHDTAHPAVLDAYDKAARALPTHLRVAGAKKGGKGKPTDKAYSADPSALRGFIAGNLAKGLPWYEAFATATTAEKNQHHIPCFCDRDGPAARWQEEKKGLIAMIEDLDAAERALVQSVHIALRQRFGAIYEESRSVPATMRNRFKSERERWRYAFAGSKTSAQIREALSDLWSRAGSNEELQERWELVLPLLRPAQWRTARDLALVALASYQGRQDEPVQDDDNESPEENP